MPLTDAGRWQLAGECESVGGHRHEDELETEGAEDRGGDDITATARKTPEKAAHQVAGDPLSLSLPGKEEERQSAGDEVERPCTAPTA